MKNLMTLIVIVSPIFANASEWRKIISCENDVLVIDENTANPDQIQIVIHNSRVATYISEDSIHSQFQRYNNNNTLVVSDLTKQDFNRKDLGFVIPRINTRNFGRGEITLEWRGSFDDARPFGVAKNWVFRSCQGFNGF